MINNKKSRAALMTAAGAYLVYTAYSLFSNRASEEAMAPWLTVFFSLFFLIAAIAVFAYAYKTYKKGKAEEEELMKTIAEEEAAKKRAEEATDEEGSRKAGL